MIEFRNVVKAYDNGTTAVDNLSFVAPTGQITVLVGPSGCGKTTTLRMINRLITPTSGQILLDGEDAEKLNEIEMRRKIGYVIQNAGLFPHHTVVDNVCAVLFLNGVGKRTARARALELLEVVGIDPTFARRYPWQLSGGQQQRVGVARALAADPPFMLMDEPFSAVDPVVRKQLQTEFLRIQSELAKTIVMVTHDIDEALRLGDQIIVLKEGGLVAQVGSPSELLARPANSFVANFLGASRGYHALSFSGLSGIEAEISPAIPVGCEVGEHRGAWVVALNESNAPIGWFKDDGPTATVVAENVVPSQAVPLGTGNRRELLDAALASPNGKAIVLDDDSAYAGTVAASDIIGRDAITECETAA